MSETCPECGATPMHRAIDPETQEVQAYQCPSDHVWGLDADSMQGLIDGIETWRQRVRSYRAAAEVN